MSLKKLFSIMAAIMAISGGAFANGNGNESVCSYQVARSAVIASLKASRPSQDFASVTTLYVGTKAFDTVMRSEETVPAFGFNYFRVATTSDGRAYNEAGSVSISKEDCRSIRGSSDDSLALAK